MYITSRVGAIIYRLVLGLAASLGVWMQFESAGLSAWRLLATWIMLITATYYICMAVLTLILRKRSPGAELCPMLQGALITSNILLVIAAVIFAGCAIDLPGASGISGVVVNFIVPMLVLFEWILFSEKGKWRIIDPWNWLAFLVIYTGAILLSAFFVPQSSALIYPYEILDYHKISILTMLLWLLIFGVIDLIFGYLILVLDFIFSGRLAQTIVLPRIKTIVIEEDLDDNATPEKEIKSTEANTEHKSPEIKPQTVQKPVIQKAESQKLPNSNARSEQSIKIAVTKPVEGLTDHKSAKSLHGKQSSAQTKSEIKHPAATKQPQPQPAEKVKNGENNKPIKNPSLNQESAKLSTEKPAVKLEDHPKTKPESNVKIETKPKDKPAAKPESKSPAKSATKPESKSGSKIEVKAESSTAKSKSNPI